MEIQVEDLKDVARGAAFLGTGGGGDPYIGRLLVQQELARGGRVRIIDPEAVDDDALIVPLATMGAPAVQIERFPSLERLLIALRTVEARLGRKASAVMPIEVGGINSTLPLAVAARTGLPVIDADGMGRAFPELQMITFSIYGGLASPMVLVDDHGDSVVVETSDNRRAEHLARNMVVAMGGGAHVALYPMSGRQMKAHSVRNTLTLALNIGRAISAARRSPSDTYEYLQRHFESEPEKRVFRVLFHGKIIDLVRDARPGFSAGKVVLGALGDDAGQLEVMFQNENIAAQKDGIFIAMVPDLICILDSETAEPVTNEALRYGQRVKVVAMSVPAIMRTKTALLTFGPEAFGLAEPYRPLE